MDKVTSELYDLRTIIEKDIKFNIPRYQRLYVWEDEQVKTLFNDILTAAQANKELYYIGGIITVKYDKIVNCFDLVDGQQRFTTLWLLTNELGGSLEKFTKSNGKLRLNFSIRHKVEDYFNQLLKNTSEKQDSEFEDLVRISKARNTIRSLITENLKTKEDKKVFIDFLTYNVKMVITEVPPLTDLNKLFETLNNRGVQLAQHEILKSQLLSKIDNKRKRYRYSKLWNACADMNNYIERSLALEIGSFGKVADCHNYWKLDWKQVEDLLKEQNSEEKAPLSLQQIIDRKKIGDIDEENESNYNEIDEKDLHPEAKDEELENVRSILTFPQLLLHSLRIYLYMNDRVDIQRINEKELLDIFSANMFIKKYKDPVEKVNNEEKESIEFMNLLFRVREAFDKYVIKWVEENENEKEETHLIKKVYKQNQQKRGRSYYLRRIKQKDLDGLALLQSILYHSQQNTTQYWLTPFLYYMLDFPEFEYAYTELKKLDNILFSTLQEHRGLPERTLECMEEFPDIQPSTKILREAMGTNFPHYWFYKLEFVLWHERTLHGKDQEWADYKMTARNSVEHISPQNPRDPKDKLCETQLHHFGNLVLVTRSINSEYSDLPFNEKKAKFETKRKKGSFDSLKSDIIYLNSTWNDKKALDHQNDMIKVLENYFQKTMNEE